MGVGAQQREEEIGRPQRWSDGALLGAFGAITVSAVIGYATFGRHPEMVARIPGAAPAYGVALRILPPLQVWAAFLALAAYLTQRLRARWVLAFACVYALSLTSELLGTGFGIPFGSYRYTAMLGTEWLGRVPIVIPLSWFSMVVASYALARHWLGHSAARESTMARTVLLTSLLLLCWDLALDPAMSHATIYWVWGAHGPYYGMPWSNLAGWYLTGIVLATVLHALDAHEWMKTLSPRWLGAFYGINLVLALGIDAAAGLWVALAATVGGLVMTVSITRVVARRAPTRVALPAGAR